MRSLITRMTAAWLATLVIGMNLTLPADSWASDDSVTEGTITALSSSSVTVDAVVYQLNQDTEYEDGDGNPIPFSSFSVGAEAKARGNFVGGILIANKLELLSAQSSSSSSSAGSSSSSAGSSSSSAGSSSSSASSDASEFEVEGVVSAITDTSLTVQNLTFTVNGGTRVINDANEDIAFALITVGSLVEIEGANGIASKVKLKNEDVSEDGDDLSDENDDVEAVGRLTAVSSDSVTVDSTTYAVNESTRIEGEEDTPVTLAALVVGMLVKVEFVTPIQGGAHIARKIEIEGDQNDDSLEATGPIGALSDNQITVRGLIATFTQSTEIQDETGAAIQQSALHVGEVVKLHAQRNSNGSLTAIEIRLRSHGANGDLNDDNKIDKVVYRESEGVWYINYLDDNNGDGLPDTESRQWGLPGDAPVLGDFDGDGRSEIAVFRPANGTWYILLSTTGFRVARTVQWGLAGDRPVPGDFDSDSISDIAVWRPSTGQWFILLSSGGSRDEALSGNPEHLLVRQWGLPEHNPIVEDRDGDGRDDLVVINPTTGVWYTLYSSSGFNRDGALAGNLGAGDAVQFGLPGDRFLAGDFDGDGRSDISAWRNGLWYIRFSSFVSDSNPNPAAFATQWGLSDDLPGVLESGSESEDQRDGLTVYRPGEGNHYDRAASGVTTITQWGLPTDRYVVGNSAVED